MSHQNNSLKLGYFLIGLGAGTLATLLFAPKSGKQTRTFITDKVEELVEGGKGLVVKGKARLVDTLESCVKFAA